MKVKPVKKSKPEITGITVAVDLPVFNRPKYADSVKWPDDITQLAAQNVSELLGKYTGLLCYAQSELANYQQQILGIEYQINRLEVTIYTEEPQVVNLAKNIRDLKFDSDEGMTILKAHLIRLKRCEVVTSMHVQNYERKITALSRELSRKTASGDGLRFANVKG